MNNLEFTHRRKNPLSGHWVLVSPHRNNRPWQGATEAAATDDLPQYDENCPLCPGNHRANDSTNPDYSDTFVFVNDFGALVAEQSLDDALTGEQHPLFQADVANGECRVVCFSPDHNKSLPELSLAEISTVIDTWQTHYIDLAKRYNCVHIFENKGEIMGCSQPHPHGQIWAHDHLSTEILQEESNQADYYRQYGRSLLGDYVEHESCSKDRIVIENEHWLVVVPFWAAWPFETLLIAKANAQNFAQLDQAQKDSLAKTLQELTIRYDNVFNCRFPYSMGWHCAPKNTNRAIKDNSHWRLHAHFYPPLLRSATVRKFMVGYEMLAESQRDLSAETAAKILRDVSAQHYLSMNKSSCNDQGK
jgi:UDPglucose--hexose-1-phosphate uridylyltransferase